MITSPLKKGIWIKRWLQFFILSAILLCIPLPTLAQTERQEEFVYGITFFDGFLYGNAVSPPQADTIYLIANVNNVVAPRNTLLYYWALTNRYMADWESKNELVSGELEILEGSKLIATIELDKYLVQYDSENPLETLKLHVGEEAEAAYQHFKDLQAKYQSDLRAYSEAQEVYRDKVSELLESDAAKQGTLTEEDFPEPPATVPPMTLYSQTVAEGFVISLPEGTYHIRTRLPDGSIQADSEKRLVMFSKLQDGASYNVVPESRWTKPEQSRDNNSSIYTIAGAKIYLAPFRQGEFNEYYYRHMEDPQDQASRIDRNIWVAFEPLKNVSLEVQSNRGNPEQLSLGSYLVQQLSGNARGYEVVLFDPESMDKPSFEGYQIEVTSNSGYALQLRDANHAVIAGSKRLIRVLYTDRAWIIYLLAFLPLLVGLGIVLDRFRSIRRIKVDE